MLSQILVATDSEMDVSRSCRSNTSRYMSVGLEGGMQLPDQMTTKQDAGCSGSLWTGQNSDESIEDR